MEFRSSVVLGGKTATGIQVPDDVVEALGAGKRPPVVVTVGGHTYRTTVAPMGGAYWIPLAAEHREAAGVRAGEEVTVSLEGDRRLGRSRCPMTWPPRSAFDRLAVSHRREWVRWVEEAKKAETRTVRIAKTVESLKAGRKTR